MATIKKFLDDLSGQSEAQKAAEKEVEVLTQMANYKLDSLEQKILEQFRNKEQLGKIEIVGDRLGEFIRDYRVRYEDGDVSEAVTTIVNEIMAIGEEDAKSLIAKTINNALKAIFATVGITESEKQLFRVNFEKVALVRYDFYVWKYSSRSDGLFTNTKSVVAFTYARSVVDHEKLSDDELNDAIEQSMGGNAEPEEVQKYKEKLIELWKIKLKGTSASHAKAEHIKLLV